MNTIYVSLITLLGTVIVASFTAYSAHRANKAQEKAAASERETTSRTTTLREMEVALTFTGQQNEALRRRVTEQDERIRHLEEEQERCRQETARLRRQIYMMGGYTDDDDGTPGRPTRL